MSVEPEPKPVKKTGVQRNDDQTDPEYLKGIEDHETWEDLDDEPLVLDIPTVVDYWEVKPDEKTKQQ